MTCPDATKEIPNYCYGEISSEIEESLESHLTDCAVCQTELARHRKFLELLDDRDPMVDAGLLVECRNNLSRTVRQQAVVNSSHSAGWRGWQRVTEYLRDLSRVHIPFRIPVGAMALMALGFLGARYTPEKFGGVREALAEPMFSSVRSVEPNASGQVQIAVDQTRRRLVSGTLEDPSIQELLVNGVTDGFNPTVRLRSIQILHEAPSNNADSEQVRNALLGALDHDPSAAVRLKALDGLKQFATDAAVRKALANALRKDDDPNVRVQAIDLLAAHHDDSIVGVLQGLVQREDNPYVRGQMTNLLAQFNASPGTY
jgi:HEAT repeats